MLYPQGVWRRSFEETSKAIPRETAPRYQLTTVPVACGDSQLFRGGDSNPATEAAYADIVSAGPATLIDLLQAMRAFLGQNDMMAYLVMMAVRLVELRRVLKPTGSIYLHCDPTASHYIKLLMDAVFGPRDFRNEIAWRRTSGHSDAGRYGRAHDVILYYGRSDSVVWNQTYQPYDQRYVDQYYRYQDPDGRRFMSGDITAAGL